MCKIRASECRQVQKTLLGVASRTTTGPCSKKTLLGFSDRWPLISSTPHRDPYYSLRSRTCNVVLLVSRVASHTKRFTHQEVHTPRGAVRPFGLRSFEDRITQAAQRERTRNPKSHGMTGTENSLTYWGTFTAITPHHILCHPYSTRRAHFLWKSHNFTSNINILAIYLRLSYHQP